MAGLDIAMMSITKLTHTGKLPYGMGITAATLLYTLQPSLFLKALSFESMIAVNLVWNLVSSVVVTLLGIFVFNESVRGLRILAVIMALFSLLLFAFTDE